MSIRFSAAEMLHVAEQIEHNGVTFYRIAAEQVRAVDAQALLLRLSNWEEHHAEIFVAMREGLSPAESEATVYDPDDEMLLYLRTFADTVVFTDDPRLLFRDSPTLDWILNTALHRERDSIIFYTGMRHYVPKNLGLEKLDNILKEEFSHIVMLEKQLAALAT